MFLHSLNRDLVKIDVYAKIVLNNTTVSNVIAPNGIRKISLKIFSNASHTYYNCKRKLTVLFVMSLGQYIF